VAQSLRYFGEGFVAVLLPVNLILLGLSSFQVGVIATAALLGSSLANPRIGVLGTRSGPPFEELSIT